MTVSVGTLQGPCSSYMKICTSILIFGSKLQCGKVKKFRYQTEILIYDDVSKHDVIL